MKEKTLLYRNTKLKLQHLGSCDPPGGTPHLNQVYTGKEEPHGTHPAPSGRPSRGGHLLARNSACFSKSPSLRPEAPGLQAERPWGVPGRRRAREPSGRHPLCRAPSHRMPLEGAAGPGPSASPRKTRSWERPLTRSFTHTWQPGHSYLQPPSPRGSGPPSGTTT